MNMYSTREICMYRGHAHTWMRVLVETCYPLRGRHRHWHSTKQKSSPNKQVGPLSTQPDLRGTPTASEGEKPSV